MEIDNLRIEIDALDSQIVSLLKQRMKKSKEIGIMKSKFNLELKDFAREQQIIHKFTENSNLNKEFVKEIYKLIFKESRRIQKNEAIKKN